jgi:hypothetical protein
MSAKWTIFVIKNTLRHSLKDKEPVIQMISDLDEVPFFLLPFEAV